MPEIPKKLKTNAVNYSLHRAAQSDCNQNKEKWVVPVHNWARGQTHKCLVCETDTLQFLNW